MGPNFFDAARILVTGEPDFWDPLVREAAGQGHYVICLDNYFTGQKRNVFHLLGNPSFEVIRHDLVNPSSWKWTRSITWPVRLSGPLSVQSGEDHQDFGDGPFTCWDWPRGSRLDPSGFHQRGVWRPFGPPPDGSYWGNVNTIGLRACYDEGSDARRRSSLTITAKQSQHPRREDLQHVRARMHPNDGR